MQTFVPSDPDFDRRVRTSFARQNIMSLLQATIVRVAPGQVDVALPVRPELGQQHGFVHAGVVTAIVDTACGYAALTLVPPGTGVLSIEFKTNLLAPARGSTLNARARVLKPGRNICVCAGDVFALDDHGETLVATMLATIMVVRGRPGLVD
ncbi:MAG TPA: PaaI family thioesterase [Myxococcaceae bacterium]|nr:PaaI family thioesterase [Myxococcaceae bacterium]